MVGIGSLSEVETNSRGSKLGRGVVPAAEPLRTLILLVGLVSFHTYCGTSCRDALRRRCRGVGGCVWRRRKNAASSSGSIRYLGRPDRFSAKLHATSWPDAINAWIFDTHTPNWRATIGGVSQGLGTRTVLFLGQSLELCVGLAGFVAQFRCLSYGRKNAPDSGSQLALYTTVVSLGARHAREDSGVQVPCMTKKYAHEKSPLFVGFC